MLKLFPEILKLLHLSQNLTPNPEKTFYPFSLRTMVSDLEALIHMPATLHSAADFSSESSSESWCQQDHIICKKQGLNSDTTKPELLHSLATLRNSVHKCYEQNK